MLPPVTLCFVIPFKDSASTLERCIKSLLNQTDPDFHCVMIDDGSSDGWSEVVTQLIDERFTVFSNPCNLGVSHSRNVGNSLSIGDYIAVLDADDEATLDRVETSKLMISQNPNVDLLITLDKSYHEFSPWLFMLGNYVTHSNLTIRKDFVFRNKLFYDPKFRVAHDYDLYCRSILAPCNVMFTPKTFCQRHDSSSGLMQTFGNDMVLETILVKSTFISNLLPTLNKNESDAMSRFLTFSKFVRDEDRELVLHCINILESLPAAPNAVTSLILSRYRDFLS